MKLLTEELRSKLPPLYSQEQVADPMVICKFFHPLSTWTWYAYEDSPVDEDGYYDTDKEKVDFLFFGWVFSDFSEFGYFSLSEMEQIKVGGLSMERDLHFTPKPLSEVKKLHQEKGNTIGMLNKIMLIGNLGKDPELNVTSDVTPVTKFSLAVNRKYKASSGELKEETEWFNVVAWRNLAELTERYLHKGSKVYIEGRLTQRKYTDRDGFQRTSVEVIASDVQFLDSKPAGASDQDIPVDLVITRSDETFLPEK